MTHPTATRAARRSTHLLHTPDTFVRTPLPEVRGGSAIVHASPALGAGFLWLTVEIDAQGTLEPGKHQRFVYVLAGDAVLSTGMDGGACTLRAGCFAYLPQGHTGTLVAATALRAIVIEKTLQAMPGGEQPRLFTGHDAAVPAEPLNGDRDLMVRALVPAGFTFDFAVNTMTYAPGAMLSQVEIHYMEHGLLMLEGSGTYLLGDRTYRVEAGDFIWMQAYCPQWFQASEDGRATYLIYKDFNRKPTL